MKKVLITGSEGFIGKNLKEKLKDKGIYPIEFKGDIVHLAALTSLPDSLKYPLDYFLTNTLGTIGLLEYARQNRIKKVIFTSSIAATKPDNPYGLSKKQAEEWCNYYAKTYGIETYILRIQNVYGPKNKKGVIYIFANQKLGNKKLTIHGTGKQTKDFIHIDDVVDGIVKLLQIKTGDKISINKLAKMMENAPKKKLRDLL